ncbi:MAG: nucleoside deaminase [Candidatus Eisenbacteria sp.]|nr:nucleoside deaminase [Candidatus Eisenbacteria bacterium]
MDNDKLEDWMRIALEEAALAIEAGELPIGGILVGGDEILQRAQTSVVREGTIVAHGELLALSRAKGAVWTANRPIALVTTLEPCLMCLGAAMQCRVDVIAYGMRCAPDGGLSVSGCIEEAGQVTPKVIGPVLESECVEMFQRWPHSSDHPAYGYVKAILDAYNVRLHSESR